MTWSLPAVGRITSGYGPRVLAGAIDDFHHGVDIGAKRGPVYAARDGVVRAIWRTSKGAWVVDVRHPDEAGHQVRTRYVHMYKAEILVTAGKRVAVGQQIGRSGASGTTAAHLHFEVMVDGQLVDPVPFLAGRGVHLGVAPVVDVTPAPAQPAPTPVIPAPPAPPTPQSEEDDMDRFIEWLYLGYLDRPAAPLDAIGLAKQAEVNSWSRAQLEAAFITNRAEDGTARVAFQRLMGHGPNDAQIAEWGARSGKTIAQVWAGVGGSPEAIGYRNR